jgi:hypothetical protein
LLFVRSRRLRSDQGVGEVGAMEVEDVHRWHEELFSRMAKAGWVESFAYSEGKGWFVTWTVAGAGQAQVLHALSERMGLRNHDLAPLAFDAFVRDEPIPKGLAVEVAPLHPVVKQGWCEAIDQLGLRGDEDGLLILMHLLATYAPDHTTPVRER